MVDLIGDLMNVGVIVAVPIAGAYCLWEVCRVLRAKRQPADYGRRRGRIAPQAPGSLLGRCVGASMALTRSRR